MFKRCVAVALVLLMLTSSLALAGIENRRILVNLSTLQLVLYEFDEAIREYPVAVGRPSRPTPVGLTAVANRVQNPVYYPRRQDGEAAAPIPPGPTNPLGPVWIGLEWRHYGIHGTNDPQSIGTRVSLGCIRMYNADVEELYHLVQIGTPVEIIAE